VVAPSIDIGLALAVPLAYLRDDLLFGESFAWQIKVQQFSDVPGAQQRGCFLGLLLEPGAQQQCQAYKAHVVMPSFPHPHLVLRHAQLAAQAASKSKTQLGEFARRMKARLGKAEGIVATAHKMGRIIYGMIACGKAYDESHAFKITPSSKARRLRHLLHQAEGALRGAAVGGGGGERSRCGSGGRPVWQ
jgi:hypothetical protein